mmetsp:Transcript_8105/g.14434  ORF Transcript_8105/g.14434 Transcript_8105/m.14434 type:complete len:202 (+) Transcript_8105:475-1080(+)
MEFASNRNKDNKHKQIAGCKYGTVDNITIVGVASCNCALEPSLARPVGILYGEITSFKRLLGFANKLIDGHGRRLWLGLVSHSTANRYEDVVGWLIPIDSRKNFGILLLKHFSVLLISLQSRAHLFLRVIASLYEASNHLLIGRRVKLHVVNLTCDRIRSASHNALHENLIRHFNHNHHVRDDTVLLQCVCLGLGSWKSIQ